MAHFAMIRALLPHNFQNLFSWAQISEVLSIDVSLGSAIGSDVANASTLSTFFVGVALPHTLSVAFTRIVPRFGEDVLAVSDFQTVQFSVFTFYELVT